jgi:CcmD family protein
VDLSQGELVAMAYAAVFVVVLVYVAIIAAKLARLQRETSELLRLVTDRRQDYAATVLGGDTQAEVGRR